LENKNLIQSTAHEVNIGHHTYPGVDLRYLVEELLLRVTKSSNSPKFTVPQIAREVITPRSGTKELTVAAMIEELNSIMSDRYSIVSDVGDCLYAGMSVQTDTFIAPGYYSSMGFGVPAGIGAQLANPSRRPIILVGDGGFQMTGMEISTAVKLGLNPIVIVFNNASYAMLRHIDQNRDYYDLPRWDYAALAKAVGGRGRQATTRSEFQQALKDAEASDALYLIDSVLAADDISPTLKRLTEHFGAKVKASIS
jgi:indolepyruvate decarboxylase